MNQPDASEEARKALAVAESVQREYLADRERFLPGWELSSTIAIEFQKWKWKALVLIIVAITANGEIGKALARALLPVPREAQQAGVGVNVSEGAE